MTEEKYPVVFDEVIRIKLQKAIEKSEFKKIIINWLDELECNGPISGKLLDNHLWLYEMKNKHPPLRLYFYHQKSTNKIIIFECEMKTSEQKQQKTINKVKNRLTKFLNLYGCIPCFLNFLKHPEAVYRAAYFLK
ncbi:hypothetical protein J4479_00945 [Candidatus Woesearchaeota archaeon]|nr:hypothetical protein [Candidatus Woesearchaeota archaeon]